MRLSLCYDTAICSLTLLHSKQGNYSIGSWAEESFHQSFAKNTELPETRSDEYDEDYDSEKNTEYHGLAMDDRGLLHTSSVDVTSTLIDSKPMPSIDVKTQKQRGAEATPFALTYKSGICLSRQPPTIDSSNNPSIQDEHEEWMEVSSMFQRKILQKFFAMHGSDLFFQPKKESAIRPSIDRRPLSLIDGLAAPEQNRYNKSEIDELVN
ncbi:hypothetical protein F2Q70_00036124 [Brassica cretica]|uniref:Uncharacterized protein n=1 Tax=Brassica cretica TaxID=69181 RepID=A0A8S9JNF4_BRACR|nr:hypothetical protein F2Q70_00036124 [Brassica cretica]